MSEALPSQVFVWGGKLKLKVLNLVRNGVLNSCRIWSPTQLHPPPHTLSVYIVFWVQECNGIRGRAQSTELAKGPPELVQHFR
jgi:hypothetical protein